MEVQLNGGSIADKVDIARNHFEKEIPVGAMFGQDEMIDSLESPRVMDSRVSCYLSVFLVPFQNDDKMELPFDNSENNNRLLIPDFLVYI